MKKVKGLICAAAAVLALASCDKTPVSDAKVGFESQTNILCMEDGQGDDLGNCLNFEIPVYVTGDNISYPVTLKIDNLEGTGAMLPDVEYSERNVTWRFLERELVIESAEDKPVVTIRQIAPADTIYVGIKLEAVSNCTVSGNFMAEALIMPEVNYHFGDYAFDYQSFFGETGKEVWTLGIDPEFGTPGVFGFMGITEEIGYPLPCATGRMDWGEEIGTIFTVALTFDGSYYIAAAELPLDETNPSATTVCLLCPILFENHEMAGYYAANVFLGLIEENEFIMSYPAAVEGPAFLAGVWLNSETGEIVGMQDAIVPLGNLVKTGSSKAFALPSAEGHINLKDIGTGEVRAVKYTPYKGRVTMPELNLPMVN